MTQYCMKKARKCIYTMSHIRIRISCGELLEDISAQAPPQTRQSRVSESGACMHIRLSEVPG